MNDLHSEVMEHFQRECNKVAKRRVLVFVVGIISAVLLPVLLVSLNKMQLQQLQLGKALIFTQANLSQLAEVEPLYSNFVKRNDEFKLLATEIVERGLVPEDWTVRQIKLSKVEATRAEAEVYLDSIAQSPTVYFIPEQFEALVGDLKDDLFRWQNNSRDSVYLTIFGRYYSRKPQ